MPMYADDAGNGQRPGEWPVLSIKQPWAHLILERRKDVEVRSWATHYRGPLWVHTGQKPDSYASERFKVGDVYNGGIVGLVVLWGARPFCSSSWEAWRGRHLDDGPFDERLAKYGWIFRNPVRVIPPIPAKGSTGLFRLAGETLRELGSHPEIEHLFKTG